MRPVKDLVGKRFKELTVTSRAERNHHGKVSWNCLCVCGQSVVYSTNEVKTNTSCGCKHKTQFRDLTGKTFNSITFLNLVGQNKGKCWVYDVECHCGKTFRAEGNDITSAKIKSCGCGKITAARDRAAPIDVSFSKAIYRDYRVKAKKRNIEFGISYDAFKSIIDRDCSYCGIPPSNIKRIKKLDGVYRYNGIDRVNNNLGYEESNCVPSCYVCNQAKHRLDLEFFKHWISRVNRHLNRALKYE